LLRHATKTKVRRRQWHAEDKKGSRRIASYLNREGIEPWGTGSADQDGTGWSPTSVMDALTNRTWKELDE
jgi:hypothetical protein